MNMGMAGEALVWTYEEICDECRQVVVRMDAARWVVGDRALLIEKQYGEHTLDDFARDIGLNKKTVYGYRTVSDFYPEILRRSILNAFPNLTYTYFKDAIRLKDLEVAIEWLEQVSTEGWTADQASYELTDRIATLGSGNLEDTREERDTSDADNGIPGRVEGIWIRDGKCIIEISVGLDDEKVVRKNQRVTIKAK